MQLGQTGSNTRPQDLVQTAVRRGKPSFEQEAPPDLLQHVDVTRARRLTRSLKPHVGSAAHLRRPGAASGLKKETCVAGHARVRPAPPCWVLARAAAWADVRMPAGARAARDGIQLARGCFARGLEGTHVPNGGRGAKPPRALAIREALDE